MTCSNAQKITDGINLLAVALADHYHKWTAEQRRAYGRSIRLLKKENHA